MGVRVQVFASEFSVEFERILQKEIANSDVLGKCRMSGVLVARGLVGPVLIACLGAFRRALRSKYSRREIASKALLVSTVSHQS